MSAPACARCDKPATCFGSYEGDGVHGYACDTCCGHGCEDGKCVPVDDKAAIATMKLRAGAGQTWCPQCGRDVSEPLGLGVMCETCEQWWRDNPPPDPPIATVSFSKMQLAAEDQRPADENVDRRTVRGVTVATTEAGLRLWLEAAGYAHTKPEAGACFIHPDGGCEHWDQLHFGLFIDKGERLGVTRSLAMLGRPEMTADDIVWMVAQAIARAIARAADKARTENA